MNFAARDKCVLITEEFMKRKMLFSIALLLIAYAAINFELPKSLLNQTAEASDRVTQGALESFDAKGKDLGLCPLKHTDVKAEISGFLARVTVTQDFQNPFKDKIEAVYTFPLPQNAAVDDMTMRVGNRVVRGKIKR